MVSVKAWRYAAPMLVAGAGVFASGATAHAAGGLTVTPAVIEHSAKRGIVGRMTLTNTTRERLRVRVTVRPWRQELDGSVVPDMRANFTRYVKAGKRKFTLRAGKKRTFRIKMRRRTRSGSLYGGIEIFGKPTRKKGRTGIIPQYRLVSKIRLNPKRKRYKLRTGAVQVRRGQILLPVRNLGNTIDPLAGNFRISGPASRNGDFKAIPALPGKLIALGAGASRGMPKGRYTLTATVTQAGHRKNVRSRFRIR